MSFDTQVIDSYFSDIYEGLSDNQPKPEETYILDSTETSITWVIPSYVYYFKNQLTYLTVAESKALDLANKV